MNDLAAGSEMASRHARVCRRFAVASLIGHCEAIAASGLLPEPSEESLCVLIAETLCEFNMQCRDERNCS